MRLRSLLAVLASLAAAGCAVRPPEPTPSPPPPRPAPTPTPSPSPVVADARWIDAPQSAGDWFYRAGGPTTRALFGAAGSEARFAITCDPAQRRITLARAGNPAGARQMIIRTECGDRALPAVPSAAGAVPAVEAQVSAGDRLLDEMAFSKGRFAVEVAGLDPLYLPSWPEVTRAIEDCRR
ncbi:MAG: hypothetical protein ACEQR8_11655 [Cypionkella sp.]